MLENIQTINLKKPSDLLQENDLLIEYIRSLIKVVDGAITCPLYNMVDISLKTVESPLTIYDPEFRVIIEIIVEIYTKNGWIVRKAPFRDSDKCEHRLFISFNTSLI